MQETLLSAKKGSLNPKQLGKSKIKIIQVNETNKASLAEMIKGTCTFSCCQNFQNFQKKEEKMFLYFLGVYFF